MSADDPFAHLHDEAYADSFARRRIGHESLIASGGRRRESLAEGWRFTIDPFDEGLRQRWYAADDTPPERWVVPRDYDFAGEAVTLPSCWNLLRPELLHYEGGVWYSRRLEQRDPRDRSRIFLRIGGANYETRIFLNGRFLGAHRGGSTPFCIELTAALRDGANRLDINIDNRRLPQRVPMHHMDWFNYGGLYREVELLRLPPVFIRRFEIGLVPDGTFANVRVAIALSDPRSGRAEVTIAGLGPPLTLDIVDGLAEAIVPLEPELWSPEHPRLYDVVARFDGDEVRERVGFREFRVRGTELLLNAKPVFLRGVCVHEDDLALGKVASEDDIRRRFAHARELNANFLRLAHYPHHERVAEIADELGVMLWAEIPVYWAIDFAEPETYADAENQLLELIARDRNRASVVIWGVGNENADTNSRLSFMARLAAAARAADSTRPIAAACLINRGEFRIEDRLAGHLDVIGVNEYFGWYEPDFAGLERLLANSSPTKPVIVAEFGADALAGHRGGERELFTEDCQAAILARQLEILARAAYVRGLCPWLLYDFRTERRQTRFQRGFNRKGLIAEDKTTRKLGFDVVASHYHARRLAEARRAAGDAAGLGGGTRS
jgi:beta-glucuronidase